MSRPAALLLLLGFAAGRVEGKERELRGHQGPVRSLAVAPDGKVLATGGYDGAIILWDVATGRQLRTLRGHDGWVWGLAFAPGGTRLASSSGDKTVRLWDLAAGKELWRVKACDLSVFTVALAPDGKVVASGGADHVVRLWDAATGKLLRELKDREGGSNFSVAFAPDGRVLASTSEDRTICLWDLATGKVVRRLTGHEQGGIYGLAFAPDGRGLASGGMDGTVRLWDVLSQDTGKERRCLVGHRGCVMTVAFFPDGRTVASAGEDRTVRLWEVATGQERRRLEGHANTVFALVAAPGGRMLGSAGEDATARLWDIARTNGLAGRSATEVELRALWDDLAGADAGRAYDAVWRLAEVPAQSVPFLAGHARPVPVPAVAEARVARLIANLDGAFRVRQAATRELSMLGQAAAQGLKGALAGKPSLEMRRRVEALLAELRDRLLAEQVRRIRAVEALERIGTPEAKRVLRIWR